VRPARLAAVQPTSAAARDAGAGPPLVPSRRGGRAGAGETGGS
jgi:hypothetical protein